MQPYGDSDPADEWHYSPFYTWLLWRMMAHASILSFRPVLKAVASYNWAGQNKSHLDSLRWCLIVPRTCVTPAGPFRVPLPALVTIMASTVLACQSALLHFFRVRRHDEE
jgi:hypothetical protein